MKQLVLCVAMLSLILSGSAFADEQKQAKESTIVGPVMQNRYIQPEDLPKPEMGNLSETSQKLMDQGVIQAAEQARITKPLAQPVRK